MARGVDGLTTEDLRRTRARFWDDEFSAFVVANIPVDARTVVDLGCGLGRAAAPILAHCPSATYIGIDLDRERLKLVKMGANAERMELIAADLMSIPVTDVDVVLTSMTLQHVPDVAGALEEIRRALRSGGIAVLIEPDNVDQRVYFDGVQREIADALCALQRRAREQRLPRDLSLGTRLPSLVDAAGFTHVRVSMHFTQTSDRETAGEFVDRCRRVADWIKSAAELEDTTEEAAALEAAIAGFLETRDEDQSGVYLFGTPVFRVTATSE